MQFRTEIKISRSNIDINYQSSVFFIGSCFSNNIGGKLQELKFDTVINPFGVLYNPLSVSENLNMLMDKTKISENNIFFDNDLWASFSFHSSYSNPDKTQFLNKANQQIDVNSKKLLKTNVLFITWGTAWVYEVKETGRVATNCHKIPATKFNRFLLEVDKIIETSESLFQKLRQINPAMQIVLTVSPIRHWKDGATGNQVSKSTLLLAANKLANKFDFVEYFPSYEIVMDDLRDYRFYEKDMLHPNSLTIEYIWEKFGDTFFSSETNQTIKDVNSILSAARHKPFNPNTDTHQKFVKNTLSKIDDVNKQSPDLDFELEKDILRKQLV